jgi:hypothetical protein
MDLVEETDGNGLNPLESIRFTWLPVFTDCKKALHL